MGNLYVVVLSLRSVRVANLSFISPVDACAQVSLKVVSQLVPKERTIRPSAPGIPIECRGNVKVIACCPIIAEVTEIASEACVFTVCRGNDSRPSARSVRKNAKREGKERHVGDIEIDRFSHNNIAGNDFHLWREEKKVRVIETARRVPAVFHIKDIGCYLLDFASVVIPLLHFRFPDANPPLLRSKIVSYFRSLIFFTLVIHDRGSCNLRAFGIGCIRYSLRVQCCVVPIDGNPVCLQPDGAVFDVPGAIQPHIACTERIGHRIAGVVDHQRVDSRHAPACICDGLLSQCVKRFLGAKRENARDQKEYEKGDSHKKNGANGRPHNTNPAAPRMPALLPSLAGRT